MSFGKNMVSNLFFWALLISFCGLVCTKDTEAKRQGSDSLKSFQPLRRTAEMYTQRSSNVPQKRETLDDCLNKLDRQYEKALKKVQQVEENYKALLER